MNRDYSAQIISHLIQWGVAEFYVCAGARNIPLVETLLHIQSNTQIVFNHFEERSAAFYAVGRIKSLNKPIAVVTTSGSAVAELLPAIMEAYYSGLPLIVITADRPSRYRGSGAPQAAEQKGIFGCYVSKSYDLEVGQDFDMQAVDRNCPVHINMCFDVPLQTGMLHDLNFENIYQNHEHQIFNSDEKIKNDLIQRQLDKLTSFLNQSKSMIVIVSQLTYKKRPFLISFLKKLSCPIYLESPSNLRENKNFKNLKIYSPDEIWKNAKDSGFEIDSVLKIGGTPTHRVWRDLDETKKDISVLSINENKFSGLPHAIHIQTDLEYFFELSTKRNFKKIQNKNVNLFLFNDKINIKYQLEKLNLLKNSEQLFVNKLSYKIKKNSRIYIGNSMPIRNWDIYATHNDKNLFIEASRGINGIDGQISTFLGFASESAAQNWGIFGDLTALYDFAGLWMLNQRPNLKVNIVIINNSGGKIFKKVLSGQEGEFCQNSHALNFKHFAKMWGIAYKKITTLEQLKNFKCTSSCLLEIIPSN